MSQKQSGGFSTVVIVIIVAVVVLAGGALAAYLISQNHAGTKTSDKTKPNTQTTSKGSTAKNSSKGTGSTPQDSGQTKQEDKNFDLLDGKVHIPDDGTWKITTGGYWNIASHHCGRGTEYDPDCLDTRMLIPSSETFTNPDQFQVNVTVFENSNGTPLTQWDLEGSAQKKTSLTINGHPAIRFETVYTKADDGFGDSRINYVISWGDKVIAIRSIVFNGNYNSYHSSIDYYPFVTKIDALARSIKF